MKRWPAVVRPALMPSTLPGTTRPPCSITSPCTGRTNCASPAPQRITLGIGSALSAASTMAARTSSSTAPLLLTRASITGPFGVSRRSSCSGVRPCLRANPAIACAGALADGPVTSISRPAALAPTCSIVNAKRRGVAYTVKAGDAIASFAFTSASATWPAKASDSARNDFGGSSSVSSSTSRVAWSAMDERETEALARLVVGLRDGAREHSHAADVGGTFGDRDRAARIEQVEAVRAAQHHLVRRQHALRFDQPLRLGLELSEVAEQHLGVRELEVVARLLRFVLVVDVPILDPVDPGEVVDAFLALQIHRQALEPVGDLAEHRLAGEAADFLEVGELRDLHAVEPHFPAEPPGAERGRFPVVLDKTDVVLLRVDAERDERLQVALLDVRRRRLEHHLVLVIVLQPVRILAVAAVLGAARGLHVGGVPRLRTYRAQESRGMERARAHLHVVGLQQHAALAIPELVEPQDQLLEAQHEANGFYRLTLARAINVRPIMMAMLSKTAGQSRHAT